jgi:hypothetical protein
MSQHEDLPRRRQQGLEASRSILGFAATLGDLGTSGGSRPGSDQSAGLQRCGWPVRRDSQLDPAILNGKEGWSRHSDLNRGPAVYETAALPLSYVGADQE